MGSTAVILAGISLATTVLGTGASLYQGAKTKEEQEKAEKEAKRQANENMEDAKARDKQLMNQAAEDARYAQQSKVTFGVKDDGDEAGSYNDFLAPKTPNAKSALGGKSTSGLGFS